MTGHTASGYLPLPRNPHTRRLHQALRTALPDWGIRGERDLFVSRGDRDLRIEELADGGRRFEGQDFAEGDVGGVVAVVTAAARRRPAKNGNESNRESK